MLLPSLLWVVAILPALVFGTPMKRAQTADDDDHGVHTGPGLRARSLPRLNYASDFMFVPASLREAGLDTLHFLFGQEVGYRVHEASVMKVNIDVKDRYQYYVDEVTKDWARLSRDPHAPRPPGLPALKDDGGSFDDIRYVDPDEIGKSRENALRSFGYQAGVCIYGVLHSLSGRPLTSKERDDINEHCRKSVIRTWTLRATRDGRFFHLPAAPESNRVAEFSHSANFALHAPVVAAERAAAAAVHAASRVGHQVQRLGHALWREAAVSRPGLWAEAEKMGARIGVGAP
ncbi:MAG: hypothetical protein M1826_000092 [Phylliscum demangeonii]|nr:MAG: hypothetical protein M1826_000092 [Phylliscum demangeonii]